MNKRNNVRRKSRRRVRLVHRRSLPLGFKRVGVDVASAGVGGRDRVVCLTARTTTPRTTTTIARGAATVAGWVVAHPVTAISVAVGVAAATAPCVICVICAILLSTLFTLSLPLALFLVVAPRGRSRHRERTKESNRGRRRTERLDRGTHSVNWD